MSTKNIEKDDFFSWEELPFARHLRLHQKETYLGLHMPGHGETACFPKEFRDFLIKCDTTELSGTDNLNDPQKALNTAQNKAAKLWGAAHSFFVTTGSSTAIKAAVIALCSLFNKREILCTRTVHQSFLHACALGQIRPLFLPLEYKKDCQPFGQPVLEKWRKFFASTPAYTPVFFTSPDYFGSSYELQTIISLAHEYQHPVIVDQAHGSHFAFCPWQNKYNAPKAGADITIHSLHKTLPALTPASLLHLGQNLFELQNQYRALNKTSKPTDLVSFFQRSLQINQTTSPSFMIGASIDFACHFVHKTPSVFWQNFRQSLELLADRLHSFGYLVTATDSLRLVIETTNIAPAEHCIKFLKMHKIEVEMHDWTKIVLLFPLNYEASWNAKIEQAFHAAATNPYHWKSSKWASGEDLRKITASYYQFLLTIPTKVKPEPPQLADLLQNKPFIPYPPGIPVRWPNEEWTSAEKDAWQKLASRLFADDML